MIVSEEFDGIDTEDEATPATFKRRIAREPSFARYTIDSSTVHRIGSDIEVGLLSLSPGLKEIEWRRGSTQPVSVEVSGIVTELCRLRMDGEAAHNLAFNLLLLLARMGEFTIEHIDANLQRLKAHVAEAGDAED